MAKSYETILIDSQGAIATVTLNRPELHNSINDVMISERTKALSELAKDPAVRLVKLTGAGESFCAGADLNWMRQTASYTKQQSLADSKKLHQMLLGIYQCPKPVVIHVNGLAMGGALGIIAAGDMAFAEESAVFSFSEVRLGLVPAVISPFIIRKIGEGKAREFFLTAERFTAKQAHQMGLVNYVGIPDQLQDMIAARIKWILQGAPGALADCKALIQKVSGMNLEEAGDYTSELLTKRRISAEGQEGMVAFFTKRKPNWTC